MLFEMCLQFSKMLPVENLIMSLLRSISEVGSSDSLSLDRVKNEDFPESQPLIRLERELN